MPVPEFPFQFLPLLAREHVVQVMGGQDRLSFSVISDSTNKLSKPRRQQAKIITVELNGNMTMKSDIEQFPTLTILLDRDGNFTPIKAYSASQYLDGVEQRDMIRKDLNRPRYSVRDWIEHFMGLVKCKAIVLRLTDLKVVKWNSPALLKLIHGLTIEQVEFVGQVGEKEVRVLEHCPTVKRAHFGDYFPTGNERVALLSREFDEFTTTAARHSRLSFQEILLMRSKAMSMMNTSLNKNSINSLLKEWMNGWNSNFEAMIFRCLTTSEDIPDILTGIDHQMVDDEQDVGRFSCRVRLLERENWNQKAYQIRRKETGVKANLNFAPVSPVCIMFKLIVQH